MINGNNNELTEIRLAEEKRAQKVWQDDRLDQLVKELRHKYIVNGFLQPFYAWNGRFSIPKERISEFGDFILPYEMAGKIFGKETPSDSIDQEETLSWIHQEVTWFWIYLVNGQQAIFEPPISKLPDILRIKGKPSKQVWKMLADYTRRMGLFGKNAGGIVISADDLNKGPLSRIFPQSGNYEGENGYVKPYEIPGEPHWITLFRRYKEPEYDRDEIEIRPAWFHIANYAFFNITITRLPVFLGVYKDRKIDSISFLDDELSNLARDFICKILTSIPIKLKKQLYTNVLRREGKELTWWLWHNVGHWDYRRPLSYGEIADITRTPRSSIQTTVERFDRKLQQKLDGNLLERLLRTSMGLGLGYNMTYRVLVNKKLAPARKREIDSFDELDKLI